MRLESIFWELSVLSRAVGYSNLSAASRHIGLSQPQLSRIIKKIEDELSVQLLDREAKRKSAWTASALDLSEQFQKGSWALSREIERTIKNIHMVEARIGTLEGLVPLATRLGHHLLKKEDFSHVDIDVHDIGDLEDQFVRGRLEFIFSFREPGLKKLSYVQTLGYQQLKRIEKSEDILVASHFEARKFEHKKTKVKSDPSKLMISNSLSIRRDWLQNLGGHGLLPTEVYPQRTSSKSEQRVLLIGAEHLSKALWQRVLSQLMKK